jgi:hypothetical protein
MSDKLRQGSNQPEFIWNGNNRGQVSMVDMSTGTNGVVNPYAVPNFFWGGTNFNQVTQTQQR